MKPTRILMLLFFLLSSRYGLIAQVTGGFVFDGLPRSFTVYIPTEWSGGDHFPLLMALHGLTQAGDEMMSFSGFNAVAEENGFIVVYPDGVSNSWNVGFPGGSTADDVGFLSALIDTLYQRYAIDITRVYATGFSNGGFMSYRLACELGGRIAAIAPVAGTMTNEFYDNCLPQRKVPVLHIHGTSDYVVFYNGGFGNKSAEAVLSFWKDYDHCPETALITDLPDIVQEGSTVQTHLWSPCDSLTEVLLYKVINGGHTWPGSVGTTGVGITNRDINASEEIWKFVSRFSLSAVTGVHDLETTNTELFPNPADDFVVLRFAPVKEKASVAIINSSGNTVHICDVQAGCSEIRIDVTTLQAGLYLVRWLSAESLYSQKLLVE